MATVICLSCGRICYGGASQDGRYFKYICNNQDCRHVFVIDTKTGKVV